MFCRCPSSLVKGRVAGVDATETGNEISQLKFEFTRLQMGHAPCADGKNCLANHYRVRNELSKVIVVAQETASVAEKPTNPFADYQNH